MGPNRSEDVEQVEGGAVVIGASGALGAALVRRLSAGGLFRRVRGFSRAGPERIDLEDETSIEAAAAAVRTSGVPLRLLVIASGLLHDQDAFPERRLGEIGALAMGRLFAVNATGPALVLKHFAPLLPARGRCVVAAVSARVGSISDNELGGWYAYRASKAALNQIVRTAAIELRRRRPEAVCVCVHPGTVASPLSAPFAKAGLTVRTPDAAAEAILLALGRLTAADTGSFLHADGTRLPW